MRNQMGSISIGIMKWQLKALIAYCEKNHPGDLQEAKYAIFCAGLEALGIASDPQKGKTMSTEEQTSTLAFYIMTTLPGEQSCDEDVGRCAVRLLDRYRGALSKIARVYNKDYAAPLATVRDIAQLALNATQEPK